MKDRKINAALIMMITSLILIMALVMFATTAATIAIMLIK